MKITVAGAGYVGLSLATLFSQHHETVALDVSPDRVKSINHRVSPISDEYIQRFFSEKPLELTATTNPKLALSSADYIIISTPTNYDDHTNQFDTSSVEDIIEKVLHYAPPPATIIIKSTIPVGYTEQIRARYDKPNIIFSPEFLREGKALYDNLYPSRIIIGDITEQAKAFGRLLQSCALNNPPILYMNSTEAEAVKLFANTYLALRVAYFNELDTYAELKGLNSKNIIQGVSLDPRIGDYYNNPSFGYGGYCLPKDTKQLLANYRDIPEDLIHAVVKSNQTRKSYIAQTILNKHPRSVGIYRLTMKSSSDNFRSSAIQDIINELKQHHVDVTIYEPTIQDVSFNGCKINNNFSDFINHSDLILANRLEDKLIPYQDKIYTRDLFIRD